MSADLEPRVGEVNPSDAWRTLGDRPSAALIDVRTSAEWDYVGVPDLSELGQALYKIEWAQYPDMSVNPRFVAEVIEQTSALSPGAYLFLCRSGVRSLRAAKALAEHLSNTGNDAECLNVAEGFEGDLDSQGHRGVQNGWKARGLAWRQS
ncbi:MAG: rhodanese-like domain-containing protein [Boseongicola sp.]|nr:rhodanese-like domain-containing protein [Boseongicola sp.]